jgi:hypothetical protein
MDQLDLIHLTLDQFFILSLDQYLTLYLERRLDDLITITNTGNQLIIINVNSQPDSLYFPRSGPIRIQPTLSITAEEDRFDLTQLETIQRRGMIQVRHFQQAITPSSGSI